jgi:hypothetical protein
MAINPYAPATATGNGIQVDFPFTFPYINQLHIKASINGVLVPAFTFFSANVLRFSVAPALGAAVRIFRETPADTLTAVIQPGGPIPVVGLNQNFLQGLYYNQETQYDAANQSTAGLQAQITAATNTANNALTVASGSGSFTQSGAGAVARTVNSKLADMVSVKDFGAVGDGITNDTAAIQAAINACSEQIGGVTQTPISKSIYFPYGRYLITTPLNLSNDQGLANRRGIRLFGDAASSGDYTYGSRLVGATNGKAVIEIIDNDNFQLTDLAIIDHTTTPSSIGVYQARRTGGTGVSGWTGNCRYTRVAVRFNGDDITKNSTFGTIGFINVSGEETLYNECEAWANLPLALSWSNALRKAVDALTASVTDTFSYSPVHANVADITTGFSNTIFRTNNCRFIAKGYNAPAVLLHEVGSYFAHGDFLQKRGSTTGPNGTNGIGYEFWGCAHCPIDSTLENIKTPILAHRALNGVKANLRGALDTVGQNVGVIHFGMVDGGLEYFCANTSITYDTPSTLANGFITYNAPSGTGANEPALIKMRNSEFSVTATRALATVNPKLLYTAVNTRFNSYDGTITASDRQIKTSIFSKSIGAPATTTPILRLDLPANVGGGGFSATVIANLHVSNAENEAAGNPSSAAISATWQVSKTSASVVVTSATSNILTSNVFAASNNITNLTLTNVVTGFTSVELRVASVQSGANLATAFISGEVTVIYAGGQSESPSIVQL